MKTLVNEHEGTGPRSSTVGDLRMKTHGNIIKVKGKEHEKSRKSEGSELPHLLAPRH